MTALLAIGVGTRCRYCVSWTGDRIHRRNGRSLWCDQNRQHAGPPNPDWLREWARCERCFE